MAGAIVPVQQAFNAAVGLGQLNQLRQVFNQVSGHLKSWRKYNRDHNPLHSRKWAKKAKGMPFRRTRTGRSLSRKGYKSYGRKRYSTAQKKVTRTRRAARRFGRVSAARKLKLPLGGFQQRKLIRLKDVFSCEPQATVSLMTGEPKIHTNGMAYADLDAETLQAAQMGKNRQFIFRLNDLRNFYNQGKYVAPSATGTAYAHWEEPPLQTGSDGITRNCLRKIPLTHVLANQYKKYTVIGSEMTIRLTNNELNQGVQGEKAHKLWYAWRITPQTPGDGSTPDGEIPEPVGADITYQQLKETGRWRCGVIQSSQNDKDAMRTFKIKFNSRKMFGAAEGQPGMHNVSGLLRMPSGVADADAENTCQSPPHVAWVQLIIGPQNESICQDLNDPTFGSPLPSYSLQHCQVDISTEFYVSLTDPYPIQAVDNDGIEFPPVDPEE